MAGVARVCGRQANDLVGPGISGTGGIHDGLVNPVRVACFYLYFPIWRAEGLGRALVLRSSLRALR